ncbi:MAG: ComF family protein [Desulfobacteraceae bacterium]|nr:ComF family protein [Desulfobacteraceae bacterium]
MSKNWRRWFHSLTGSALEALLPGNCLVCGCLYRIKTSTQVEQDPSWYNFQDVFHGSMCPACAKLYKPVESPLCARCGRPFESAHSHDHICGECQKQPHMFEQARCAGHYEGALRIVIHHFKYRRCDHLAKPLGRLLWQVFTRNWRPEDIDLVLPVPLHPKRMRQRGFNQAQLLTRTWLALSKQQGIMYNEGEKNTDLLIRIRNTAPQTGLDRKQRMENLKKAFELKSSIDIKGCRVLLIDDVFTTGSTVNACCQVLMKGGARSVSVLTVARAV